MHVWKRSPAAAFVFGHLHLLGEEFPPHNMAPDGESAELLDALTGKLVAAAAAAVEEQTPGQRFRCRRCRPLPPTCPQGSECTFTACCCALHCSLADCFAELPSIHSHKDAIRVPPPPQPVPGRPSLLALPEGVLREVLKVGQGCPPYNSPIMLLMSEHDRSSASWLRSDPRLDQLSISLFKFPKA